MWGDISRSTYSWLNSAPVEISGIISVATGAELSQHQLLFKVAFWKIMSLCVIKAGIVQNMNPPNKAILSYDEWKGPERNQFWTHGLAKTVQSQNIFFLDKLGSYLSKYK